jgi:peptide/nickel transport system substrate-binding protein
VARALALAAAIAVSLLAVSGAGGARAQTPKRGGTVVIPGLFGGSREPACLNPLRSCGEAALDHIAEVLEGAFELGPDRVRPNLVTRVEFTRKPPFTLTYHIRPEARWSDGVHVTGGDFEFTHQAIRRAEQQAGVDTAHLTSVRNVRAIDAKTVRVVLRDRRSDWRARLFALVLPRHALRGENLERVWTDRIDNPKTGAPIGSGPFLVERWERGRQLVLRRNSRYWGPHTAYLDRLVIRFGIDDPVEALRSGALDVYQARLGLDPTVAREFLRIPGVEHRRAPGFRWEHFEIRIGPGGHPSLRNKLVRRALAYGIDRAALVRSIFGEVAPRMRPADSAVFLPSSPYYEPNWRKYRHRPELARRLLAQAGCRRGADGIRSCAGERLSLRFVANTGVASRSRLLDLVQVQLRRIGVEVRPSYSPGPVLAGQVIPSGEWDVWPISYFYVPEQAVDPAFRCQGPSNATGYCQRLVTRELDAATRILDSGQYARALNRADVQMARDVPVIPLWQEPTLAMFRSTVRGFAPTEPVVAWNAENWWLER